MIYKEFSDKKELEELKAQLCAFVDQKYAEEGTKALIDLLKETGQLLKNRFYDLYISTYMEEPKNLSQALQRMTMRDISPMLDYLVNLKAKGTLRNTWQILKAIRLVKKYTPELMEKGNDDNGTGYSD